MDRCRRRSGRSALSMLLLATLVVCQSGCINALVGAMYVFQGDQAKAEFKGLKGKRVAIVCRPVVELQYATASVSSELSTALGVMLQKNLKKIDVIDPQQVAEWTDENQWEDFSEIGQALDADMIIGIDLQSFSIYQGQTLYQGKAQAVIKVYDIKDGSKVVFQKTIPRAVYPPNTGVPTSEKSEEEFRQQFVVVLSDRIGRYFYSHDIRDDIAGDAAALQ
jgi:hypothetical protein